MQTATAVIDFEELTRRIQTLDGAENKQAIVGRLADVIEAAHARGASYKTICAALHADVQLTVSTLKTYLRRAKSRRTQPVSETVQPARLPRVDRAETPRIQPQDRPQTAPLPSGHTARSREDIISAGSFKPRADRSDI